MKIQPFTISSGSAVRPLFTIICALVLIAIPLSPAHAAACTFTSQATGNWDSAATWDAVGSACSTYPGQTYIGDSVVIAAGNTVTVNVSPTASNTLASVTVNGTLNYNQNGNNLPNAGSLTVASGGVLNWYRTWTITGATTITGTVNFGSTGVPARDMTFGGNVTLNNGAVWTEPASGNGANNVYWFAGSFTNNATTFTAAGTGNHNFTGTGAIGGTTVSTLNNMVVGATLTNNGTLSVLTALTGAGTLVNVGTLNYGGSGAIGPTLTATGVGNVVNYTRAGAQTVKATAYDHLVLSGSGAKTVAAGFTITNANGNLSIAPTGTATLSMGNTNFSVSSLTLGGIGQASGTYGSTASAATNQLSQYFGTTGTGILTVGKSTQAITFGTLADKAYADPDFAVTATASSGLTVVFSTTTSSVCTATSGGTVHIVALGTCTIDANQAGNGSYTAAPQVSQSFTVQKANQTISFGTLSDKTYGDVNFAVTASASSTLPVSFSTTTTDVCTVTADGTVVHLVGVGTCTIDADQAGDTNYNAAPRVSQGFNVAKADQTISFGALADKTFGDADFPVSATASSTLPVSFSTTSTGVCTVTSDGLTVHLAAAGTCTIDADQAGDANYNAAPRVSQSFTVNKDDQTIDFGPLADKTFGDANFSVSATASSDLPVIFSSATTSICTVTSDGLTVELLAAGTCTLDADQPGDGNYNAATQVPQSFTVNKADQTITFGLLSDKTYGDLDFSVTATSSSGLPVSFSTATTSVCTVTADGLTVHLAGAGDCTLDADQAGSSDYNAAVRVSQGFTVHKADQIISFGTLSDKTYGDADFAVSATADSGLAVSFSTTTTSVCTVTSDGLTVHLVGGGTCTIDADQAGDGNYNAALRVSQGFTVLKADQTITFGTLADKTYGDADFSVSATASSTLPVSFSTATTSVCTVTADGTVVHLVGGGTCTIDADQGGDTNYNAAPQASQSFNVGKASQTISFGTLTDKTFGDADFSVTATASSGLAVSFSTATTSVCTVTSDGVTVHLVGAGTCTIDADQAGDTNYSAALQVPQSFNVGKANQTINFGTLSSKVLGDPDFAVTATATSGLPVSFSTTTASVCTVSSDGTVVHLAALGTCAIDADQAGDTNYNAAVRVSQSFDVLVAPAPVFTADPTSWGFGIVKNGTSSAAKVFTITNTGTADLVFNGAVTLGGTDAGQFLLSADTCSNATLAATTGACSITATFKPTIKGLKNATISFPDNAAGNPHTIALTGTGGAELLWNGGFNVYVGTTTKIPRYWQAMNFASTDGKSTTIKQEGTASVRMGNTSAVTKTLTETRMITGPAGTTFQLSVWAKGQKVPTTAGMARVVVQFYNGTKLVQTKFINMPTGTYAFTQKKTAVFSTTQSYTKVVIKLIYSKGSGAIWFDGLSLMRLK